MNASLQLSLSLLFLDSTISSLLLPNPSNHHNLPALPTFAESVREFPVAPVYCPECFAITAEDPETDGLRTWRCAGTDVDCRNSKVKVRL